MTPPLPTIALLPLDSRPVCTQLPQQLAAIVGLTLHMPDRAHLNHLKQPAQQDHISKWLKTIPAQSTLIVAIDTLAYGGLIPSRQGTESLEECQTRVEEALHILEQKQCRVVAFSSIMRTPDYNNAEEEPPYWETYGQDLHAYSAAMHRDGQAPQTLIERIPPEVLTHFLETRARNFQLNQWLLTCIESGTIDELIFCLDDSGEYGLNKAEAATLSGLITEKQLDHKVFVQTGADEVACSALSRILVQHWGQLPRVWPFYTDPRAIDVILKFDGIPVQALIERHIQRAGGQLATTADEADLWMLVHTPPHQPKHQQGDWCEKVSPQTTPQHIQCIEQTLQSRPDKPFIICDIAAANGGDPHLVFRLLQWDGLLTQLAGYAGWNTPGNATGTALSMGLLRWLAEQQKFDTIDAHRHAVLTRFADDWLYQAEVRRHLPNPIHADTPIQLKLLMDGGLGLLTHVFHFPINTQVDVSFPCQRRFEVEITLS